VEVRGCCGGGAVDEPARALLDLVAPWTTQSNGRAAAVAADGDVVDALAALGRMGPARVAGIDAAEALAVMAWAGASGGAHGRRRGMAQGRFGAWWTAATLAGTINDWPDIRPAVDGAMRWYRWDLADSATGWVLRLAAERPSDGRAWAIEATDHR
jgi:hypothetical protein